MIKNDMIKKWATCCLIGMTVGLSGCHSSQSIDNQVIIPTPLAMEKTNGSFTFNAQTVIAVPSENEVGVANLFASLFTGAAGFTPEVKVGTEGNIILEINDALKEDAYEMTVEKQPDYTESCRYQRVLLCFAELTLNATSRYRR